MTDSSSSDIVQDTQLRVLANGVNIEQINFRDGKVLLLSSDSLAFYQSQEAIDDALGNGLIALVELPATQHLPPSNTGWVESYKAGFIGLNDQRVILITPMAIQFFTNKLDALYNRDEICRLDIPA